MGSNEIEAAVIDSYCEYLRDFKYDNLLTINETHSQFSMGNKLSLADVSIYSFLVEYFDNKEGVLEALKDCKKLRRVVETVKLNKKIKNWLTNRPVGSY